MLITYTIPSEAGSTPVLLSIYDAAGRLVRTLVDSRQMPSRYAALWDATGRNGDPVAGGIYYSRLTAGGKTATRPIVLIQ